FRATQLKVSTSLNHFRATQLKVRCQSGT
ncbi:hypothetical protein EVA_22063, partial [gut metagenome]